MLLGDEVTADILGRVDRRQYLVLVLAHTHAHSSSLFI